MFVSIPYSFNDYTWESLNFQKKMSNKNTNNAVSYCL